MQTLRVDSGDERMHGAADELPGREIRSIAYGWIDNLYRFVRLTPPTNKSIHS